MNTCSECRHWRRSGVGIGSDFGLGECKAIPMFWDSTEWNEEGERQLLPQYRDTKAFAQDASDYSAYLLTMPDFGCVMHEPASPSPDNDGHN